MIIFRADKMWFDIRGAGEDSISQWFKGKLEKMPKLSERLCM